MAKIGEFNYQQFLAGDFPRVTETITLKAGRVYPMGSAIGIISAEDKGVLVDSANSDGSQNLYGILIGQNDAWGDVDATAEDQTATVFLTGEFSQERITFGGTDTFETHKQAARALGIYFKSASLRPNQ